MALAASPFVATTATAQEAQKFNIAAETYVIPPRDTAFCGELARNAGDRELGASVSASLFSKANIGKVGVSIYPAQDLGDKSPEFLGTVLINSLRKRGVDAECFVHHSLGEKGTGVDFIIEGRPWREDRALNLSEALDADLIDTVAAQAKTTAMLKDRDNRSYDVASTFD